MKQIGASDAKRHFSKLLTRIRRGEEVIVTHRGQPVAQLVPIAPGAAPKKHDPKAALAALAAFRRLDERARKEKLGPFDWNEWKAYRDEGRR